MSNLFDKLPIELVINIFSYMSLDEKEKVTKVYPQYYDLIKERKRRFLEENYQVNYKPLVKKGIDYFVNENKICIKPIMRKKRFYIDCFPEPLRRFFIDYNTPIIPYKCKFRSKTTGIFHCELSDLKYKISVGMYPAITDSKPKRFIFLKSKYDSVISMWEKEIYGQWDCYFGKSVHKLIGMYYVNFTLLEYVKMSL